MHAAALGGMASWLSIAQLPAGIPVGSMAIGRAGAVTAALRAAALLANTDAAIAAALDSYRSNQTDKVLAASDPTL